MTGVVGFFLQYGYDFLSAVGIITGLSYTAVSFQTAARSRRLENLLHLTRQHREIWAEIQSNPSLARITDPQADLAAKAVTSEEVQFVVLLIFHLHCWYRLAREGEVTPLEGLTRDIQGFFGRPVPAEVWREKRVFQERDFINFVEASIDLKQDSQRIDGAK